MCQVRQMQLARFRLRVRREKVLRVPVMPRKLRLRRWAV